MSYWKAYAQARDIPEGDRFDHLVSALETLHRVADSLDVGLQDGRALRTNEEGLLSAIDDLRNDLKDAQKAQDETDVERHAAEEELARLKSSGPADVVALRDALRVSEEALARSQSRNEEAFKRLDAYAARDTQATTMLEAARRLVRLADGPSKSRKKETP